MKRVATGFKQVTKLEPPWRRADSHKGQNGLVLVIGGSKDYVGAPALAGLAALRSGCDIVKIATPEKVAWAINSLSPDLITVKLDGDYISKRHIAALVVLARKSDVVIIGPGMAVSDSVMVNELLASIARCKIPMVVDADALKVAKIDSLKDSIITPHRKEFEMFLAANRLSHVAEKLDGLGDSGKAVLIRKELSSFFAGGNVLLLKGVHDLVVSDKRYFVSKGGNAGMTVGGTGDILSGLCAGFLAQTKDLFMSAALGSRKNKKIGDALLERSNFGFGFIASDFLRLISKHGCRCAARGGVA